MINVCPTAIKSLLVLNEVLNLVLANGSDYHIYLNNPPPSVGPPYIKMRRHSGGEDNEIATRSIDMIYEVVAQTSEQDFANELATEIEAALVSHTPSAVNGWSFYAPIKIIAPVSEFYSIQNQQYWQVGFLVRLRANLTNPIIS